MKHTLLYAATAVAVTTLAACSFQEENLFDQSAALRIESTNADVQARLVAGSAQGQNGWLIQYFVGGTDNMKFEGFNLFGRFYESGKVTLSSDHRYLRNGQANKYTEYTSYYEMVKEEGSVLAFNTWNDVLTVFVDPVNPASAPGRIDPDGEGMNGDDRLVLQSYSDDEMLFRGERHSSLIHFVRLDRTPQQYIADVAHLKGRVSNTVLDGYYVVNGQDTMYLTPIGKGYFKLCDRLVDPLQTYDLSCVFTPDGFRLSRNREILRDTCQTFTVDADTSRLVSGDVQVIPCWDTYVAGHTALWAFDSSRFSAAQQEAYAAINAALKAFNANYELSSIAMGRSTGGGAVKGLVLQYYTNAAKTKTNNCGIALASQYLGYGKVGIALADNPARDINFGNIVKKSPALLDAVLSFAGTLTGTYTMVPDDYFLPTGAAFTPAGAGTAFVLSAK